MLTASSLAWVELWRSLRRADAVDAEAATQNAVVGIAEFPLDDLILTRAVAVDSLVAY